MLFTCPRSIHINTDRKELKQVLHFRGSVLNRDFPKLTSISFSLRPSVLRHVMYTIVGRYDNEREPWSKSRVTLASQLGGLNNNQPCGKGIFYVGVMAGI
jgi:hypothetical protein